MIRLDKFLTDCGLGSRSDVKKLIKAGKIMINREIASKPEQKVDEEMDEIFLNGRRIEYERYVYYLLHKPSGCVTAKKDNLYPTVMEYFPKDVLAKDIAPVGRLDLDTEGLLLFTNDGALAHHLLSPSHHVSKTYYAIVDKTIPQEAVDLFAKGVDIGDEKLTLPAKLTILEEKAARLTICEGRFHQVKRMFTAVGCNVTYLRRESMGGLCLSDLPRGEIRKLLPEEVQALTEANGNNERIINEE